MSRVTPSVRRSMTVDLSPAARTAFDRMLRVATVATVAHRLHLSTYTVEGLADGGRGQPRTVAKVEAALVAAGVLVPTNPDPGTTCSCGVWGCRGRDGVPCDLAALP